MTDPIAILQSVTAPRGSGYFGVSGGTQSTAAVTPPAAVAASDTASASKQPAMSLDQAIQQVGKKLKEAGVDVTFSVDQQLQRVIVKVVDQKDGTVLRQIPSEEMLHLARVLDEQQGGLLQETV